MSEENKCDCPNCTGKIIFLENIPELQNNPVTIAYIGTLINFTFKAGNTIRTPFLKIELAFGDLTVKYGSIFIASGTGQRLGELALAFDDNDKPVYMICREFINGELDESEIAYYMFENHDIDHEEMLTRIRNMPRPEIELEIVSNGKTAPVLETASIPSGTVH